MFYFRLNKVRLFDNGTIKPGLGLFGHDFAQVKFLSFVTTDNTALPDMDAYVRSTRIAERTELLKEAVTEVVASRVFTEIDRVGDNQSITFGDTGCILYQADKIPESFNWTFLALKSKRGVREQGAAVDEVLQDREFAPFSKSLLTLGAGGASAANPGFAAGVAVAKFAAQVAARNMMRRGDKQLGAVSMSLTHSEHYPHGERKADDVSDLTGNMTFDYSIFAFERALPV